MPHKIYQATISANGELIDGSPINELSAGDQLELCINGQQLVSNTNPLTLLGRRKEYLPHSHHFELTAFQPQPNGTCQLRYTLKKH